MIKVKLLKKAISEGRHSLYLDFYPPITHPETGKPTRREFLKIYILDKPKTEVEKHHRKEILDIAEGIRSKRQEQVFRNYYGFLSTTKQNGDFVQYFSDLSEKRTGSNSDNWFSALNYLKDFTGGLLRFSDLTEHFCNKFRDFLLTAPSKRSNKRPLSQNSAHSYFNKFKASLRQAFRDGFLEIDLNGRIDSIKQEETERNFLTFDELQKLVTTECDTPILKKAGLFSALTGLRFSDIEKLVWGEVRKNGDKYALHFMQKKTKGQEVTPIPEAAYTLLGEPGATTEKVFEGLKYSAHQNLQLSRWIMRAGIHRKITFHCFRHTFAALQQELDTDVYTLMTMMGHKDLKSTQIYTKPLEKKKQDAANKIKLDLRNLN